MVKVLSLSFKKCFRRLTMVIVETSSERDFLDSYLTTFFRVEKFKNTIARRVIFFLKMFKIEPKFKNKKKKKKVFVSEIIASENVAINCLC